MSSSQANPSVSTYVPILDGTNYREWLAQMRAYLRSVGYWLIVNGTTTAPTDPAELAKWTLLDSMANGAIELRCSLNIRDLIAATSAATWTALSTAFGATGVSRLFGDFKAVTQFRFSGTQHPAAEISHYLSSMAPLATESDRVHLASSAGSVSAVVVPLTMSQ